eukprot:TRINITY_DN0_c0_g1_i1.p1 TRINITY_DN0_c0_g1~~TRINITY_DN0_c0_g1_i1.p1  ORF type:complete len:503 (+),score=123.28 TRINITY_DN0_c0_g1_i1:101-1609(+)
MTRDDVISTASEMSYDPYAEIPADMSQQMNVPVSTTHMPYGASYPGQMQQQQQQYISVVHPSGKVAWIPFQEGTSMAAMKEEAARQLRLNVQEGMQFARVTPMLEDTPVDRQCMANDVIYILPNTAKQQEMQPQMYQQTEMVGQPGTPLIPSVPSTPLSASGNSFTSAMYHSNVSSFSQNSMPMQSMGQAGWPVQLEDKLQNAAATLLQVISQSRQCTELQQDLETAITRGLDCTAVFQAVERHLPELILHPSGNYLVSKCFELCPTLIDTATAIICGDVRMYALHKHGSYVVEAILGNTRGSKQSKCDLITALLNHQNRIIVATHDSGNFVLQRAIEYCPDELLWHLQESINSVFHMSTHGPKMLKKLETRILKSVGNGNTNVPLSNNSMSLPLPPSTMAYMNQVNGNQSQQQSTTIVAKTEVTAVTEKEEEKNDGKETWVIDTAEAPKEAAKEKVTTTTTTSVRNFEFRTQYSGESWADAEDGPLSPPPMFTEGGRVPIP